MKDNRIRPIASRSPAYNWYVLALVTLAAVISFVDRYALAVLVQPIKADLGCRTPRLAC
jgi:hypothetical protein